MAVTKSGKDKLMKHMRLYVGGYDLSGDARSFNEARAMYGQADLTGWSDTIKNYMSDYRIEAGLTGFQALMNDTAGRSFDQLTASTANRLSLCFGGGGDPAVGDPAYILPSVQISAPVGLDGSVAALTGVDFMPDAAQVDANSRNPIAVVLRGPTSLSATLTGGSSNSVDNEAAASDGWTACLHVLATSSGDYAFKIRHSTDDSSYADLGTFTADGSAITSEYLTGSGTVNQYVALDATKTAGTVTVVVTFARN